MSEITAPFIEQATGYRMEEANHTNCIFRSKSNCYSYNFANDMTANNEHDQYSGERFHSAVALLLDLLFLLAGSFTTTSAFSSTPLVVDFSCPIAVLIALCAAVRQILETAAAAGANALLCQTFARESIFKFTAKSPTMDSL